MILLEIWYLSKCLPKETNNPSEYLQTYSRQRPHFVQRLQELSDKLKPERNPLDRTRVKVGRKSEKTLKLELKGHKGIQLIVEV